MSGQNKSNDTGCFGMAFGLLLLIGLVVLALSAIGHVLGLTPSVSAISDKPDGWISRHYEGVVVGYGLTVLLLVLVAAVVLLALQTASDDPSVAAQGQTWIRRVGPALTLCVLAVIVLPIGEKADAEGNVPKVVGMNAAQAEDAVDNASLSAEFEQVPRDDDDCKVTKQEPRAGADVDEYTDVRMRCVVAIPAVVGQRADTAEGRLQDVGFTATLTNEPSDFDTSRCRVARQSPSAPSPPDTKISLRLKCKKPPPEPKPEPVAQAASNCEPGYEPCLRASSSDYDCLGGEGDGPDYTGPVTVTGPDRFDLDRDDTGMGCTSD